MKKFVSAFVLILALCTAAVSLGETVTISLVGDCTVGDQWKYRGMGYTFTGKMKTLGLDYPFSLVADLFAADDLTLANCEGCLTDRKPDKKVRNLMTLGAPTSFGEVFKLGNVDACGVANNHSKNFGEKGWIDTINTLNALGIGTFGDSEYFITEIKGAKIGIFGFSYPYNEAKFKRCEEAIAHLKEEGCTFIIASCHWGKEESLRINASQSKYAPMLIDAGVDMVYGHGSHTLQPIQIYNGKVILYSTSNFTFGANARPKDDDTAVFQVIFNVNADGTMDAVELTAIPFKMHNNGDYRPYPIEDEAGKEQVLRKLVFSRPTDPDSGLPEDFIKTGHAVLKDIPVVEE
ncbi:MAG: CapA family protein [Clostridia bacterium]|nr:CapA family protein [Clostridia bacterium]